MIGSRLRKYINESGHSVPLNVRRLGCKECHKVHHELPDFLVPYKRYGSSSIESVLTDAAYSTVPADESTLYRWKAWFSYLLTYLIGCLEAILIRTGEGHLIHAEYVSKSLLQRIWHYVGDACGWLARVVRPSVNLNLWIHTRSAFLS